MESADVVSPRRDLQPAKYDRTVYPYSVIPGGVRTRAELASRMAEDPVIESHYENFDVAQARFVKSGEMQPVHVAYRIGEDVFWTAKTVRIPEGETLITDGSSLARTRCGNRISVLPQEPVSEAEPPIETFDIPVFETPMIARLDPPQLDITGPPVPDLEISPVMPAIPYVPVRAPAFDNLRYSAVRPLALFPQFHEVPEPGTIGLTFLGLVTLFAVRLLRKN